MDLASALGALGETAPVLNAYPYGSRVYGTHTERSDHDFIVVVEGSAGEKREVSAGEINATLYDERAFREAAEAHDIGVLECLFLPKELVLLERLPFEAQIDLGKLRAAVSAKASNSWAKAKKKMTVEKDFDMYIAKKSLFHAIRIPMFGGQIAAQGRIFDFSEANGVFADVFAIKEEAWEPHKAAFQPLYNSVCSRFREAAPKAPQ